VTREVIVFAQSIIPVTLSTFLASEYPWWNYPSLELWKFVNLFVFIGIALYIHRRFGRPVREGLRARRERIKTELETARQERDLANAKLADVEARFEKLDAEVAIIREKAKAEAEAESRRLQASTEQELARIRENARRELESAGKLAKHELRKFAAQESVRIAEEILSREIKPEDDERLTTLNLQELGRTSS
jgi:F-type H+-transporting ATPase subunit b